MTKTQAVSDLLDKKPDISAVDAITELAKKGVTINMATFYNYKGLWKKAKAEGQAEPKKAKAEEPAEPKKAKSEAGASKEKAAPKAKAAGILATLQKLEELAEEVGGYEELKKLVEFLEK